MHITEGHFLVLQVEEPWIRQYQNELLDRGLDWGSYVALAYNYKSTALLYLHKNLFHVLST